MSVNSAVAMRLSLLQPTLAVDLSVITLYITSIYIEYAFMLNLIDNIILGITVIILITGIVLYRRKRLIKARNNLKLKRKSISSPSIHMDANKPIRKIIYCSGMYDMLKIRNNMSNSRLARDSSKNSINR